MEVTRWLLLIFVNIFLLVAGFSTPGNGSPDGNHDAAPYFYPSRI